MNSSRRRIAALALTLMAAVGLGAALGSNAQHSSGPRVATNAGGSWYHAEGIDPAA